MDKRNAEALEKILQIFKNYSEEEKHKNLYKPKKEPEPEPEPEPGLEPDPDSEPEPEPDPEKELHYLINSLRYYIATPWNNDGAIQSYVEYKEEKIPQSHAGDLFQHSLWSCQWIEHWEKNKSDTTGGDIDCNSLIQDLSKDKKFLHQAKISAYIHDIGKGGDYIYDMYDSKKCEGAGDSGHPDYSKQYIMGEKEYGIGYEKDDFLEKWVFPNNPVNKSYLSEPELKLQNKKKINVKNILNGFGMDDETISRIAIICAMHWEFGKLNLPEKMGGFNQDYSLYIKKLEETINDINEMSKQGGGSARLRRWWAAQKGKRGWGRPEPQPEPEPEPGPNSESEPQPEPEPEPISIKLDDILLKQCILVSCADICAANSPFFKGQQDDTYHKYNTGNPPWTRFGMDTNHPKYIKGALDEIKENSSELRRGISVEERVASEEELAETNSKQLPSDIARTNSEKERLISKGGRGVKKINKRNKRNRRTRRNKRTRNTRRTRRTRRTRNTRNTRRNRTTRRTRNTKRNRNTRRNRTTRRTRRNKR